MTEAGIDPRQFELEITEGVLVANNSEMRHTLQTLHGMGFTIALDDFGTGYSSLSYLARFPIDKIKVDRSFVCRLPDDRQAYLIIRAIVQLAKALEMTVIAEGVETLAQQEMLSLAGCTRTQGYLKGRPMAAELIAPVASLERTTATAA
nr:EAL domain-containing protein [uncultured Lichenicoccus sp.]